MDKDESNLPKQIARLERLNDDKLHEIERLKQVLEEEETKTIQYSQQIDEMTDFLADYGLHWVGGEAPKVNTFPRGPTDMGAFMQKIRDLNNMAESTMQFAAEGQITRVKQMKPITIKFLEEGFQLDEGEIRLYSLPINVEFIQDILDGFFPIEFKEKYPEGVQFTVIDQRNSDMFKGDARRLIESARRENRVSNSDNQPQNTNVKDIGDGDGKLKLKMPQNIEVMVHANKEMTIGEIRNLIANTYQIQGFKLFAPPSQAPLEDESNIEQIGLYPRGLLLLIM